MAENVKPIENNVVEEAVNNVVNSDEVQNGIAYANILKKLVANGCKAINGVKIKNVNFTDKDSYTMVSFTLCSQIPGYTSEDNGVTYKLGTTNILFTSLYAIAGAFKEDDELSWMANAILEHPQALNLILNGATINIIQQEFAAGEEVVNPFSKNNNGANVYDHDVIINHVVGFKLGKVGNKMADKLADKLFGF